MNSADVDAIHIATPNFSHTDFAVRALKASLHVLLEKSMVIGVPDCRKIIAASKESGAKLMIANPLKRSPMAWRACSMC